MPATSLLLLLLAQSPLEQGLAQFHRGEYTAALRALESAADSPHRSVFLALARAATGGCEAASPSLAALFESVPDADLRRLAGLGLSQCLLARGRIDEAAPVLARLRSLYPADPDVIYQTARLHHRAWNDAVFQLFQNAAASFRVNQLSAEIFELQGKYPEAIAEYRKAIEKNPAALNLHYRLGRALLMETHSSETLASARREFEAELALNPGDAIAHFQIGQILVAQQQPDEAAQRFERALEIQRDFPEAQLALARLRLQAGRNDESIALLEQAIRAQPKNEAAHYSLMLAYRNAGRAADAARVKAGLDKLQRPPEGEFTEFLKRLGEKTPRP
ncbi:MAG: tetratricopeptide repeat protein [Bryobacteraceae bacterium]